MEFENLHLKHYEMTARRFSNNYKQKCFYPIDAIIFMLLDYVVDNDLAAAGRCNSLLLMLSVTQHISKLTSNIRACGEWQKNDGFSVGDASRHNCWSQALGLYINMMTADKWPSYKTWQIGQRLIKEYL